jgi:hypothetical protein
MKLILGVVIGMALGILIGFEWHNWSNGSSSTVPIPQPQTMAPQHPQPVDWVTLPVKTTFSDDIAGLAYGQSYELRKQLVRYNPNSLELQLMFDYRATSYYFPRIHIELVDKNGTVLCRGKPVVITHSPEASSVGQGRLVFLDKPNLLSWFFAQRDYVGVVSAIVVVGVR